MNNKSNANYAKYEEYKKTLTPEQYKALLLNHCLKRKERIQAEMERKVKEYKKLKRELRECNESILLFSGGIEAFMEGA